MPDLSIDITDVRDYSIPQRDGTSLRQKRVTFYLGKFGPFVEMFPSEEFTDTSMKLRVGALQRELEAMHR